jgi:thiol-disulfide isomerase/thioredoxin
MSSLTLTRVLCCAALLSASTVNFAASTAAGPTDAKAQKTYTEALDKLQKHQKQDAIDAFKKADKQDGHHCAACQQEVVSLGLETGDYKLVIEYSTEMLADAKTPVSTATGHFYRGLGEVREGMSQHKQPLFTAADEDLQAALAVSPNSGMVLYADGLALANLNQDDAARARFQAYLKTTKPGSVEARRAFRYVSEPQLARARMAPPFEATTIDGQRVSLDDLQGKVVLIDFWATWCGPCREALPGIQHIAQKFAGQPFVVLSVSLDSDDAKWKKFVADNKMTWLQTRDGGWNGPISSEFNVKAIPHTFTIDADGVLQDEHIGDAGIEGKIKKLIAQAQQARPAAATEEARTGAQ